MAVLERAYAAIRDAEQAVDVDHLDPVAAIRRLAELTFDHHEAHPEFIRLVSTENIHRGEHMGDSLAAINAPAVERIDRILQRGREASEFRDDVDAVDLHMLISAYCVFRVANRSAAGAVPARPARPGAARALPVDAGDVVVEYLTPTGRVGPRRSEQKGLTALGGIVAIGVAFFVAKRVRVGGRTPTLARRRRPRGPRRAVVRVDQQEATTSNSLSSELGAAGREDLVDGDRGGEAVRRGDHRERRGVRRHVDPRVGGDRAVLRRAAVEIEPGEVDLVEPGAKLARVELLEAERRMVAVLEHAGADDRVDHVTAVHGAVSSSWLSRRSRSPWRAR